MSVLPPAMDRSAAEIPVPAALGARLQEALGWQDRPATLADAARHLCGCPEEGEGLTEERLVSGTVTPHAVQAESGPCHTYCALDALLLPHFRGAPVELRSPCPHCGTVVIVHAEGTHYRASSPSAVLSLGVARTGSGQAQVVLCPYIQLFPDHSHYATWAADMLEAVTMTLPLEAAAVFATTLAGCGADQS